MYADTVTDSMREAIDETNRRRAIQMQFNEEHGIKPKTVRKAISDISSFIAEAEETVGKKDRSRGDTLGHGAFFSPAADDDAGDEGAPPRWGSGWRRSCRSCPRRSSRASSRPWRTTCAPRPEAMDFEEAARLRDAVVSLKAMAEGTSEDEVIEALRKSARKGVGVRLGPQTPRCAVQEVGWYTYPRENRGSGPLGREGHD